MVERVPDALDVDHRPSAGRDRRCWAAIRRVRPKCRIVGRALQDRGERASTQASIDLAPRAAPEVIVHQAESTFAASRCAGLPARERIGCRAPSAAPDRRRRGRRRASPAPRSRAAARGRAPPRSAQEGEALRRLGQLDHAVGALGFVFALELQRLRSAARAEQAHAGSGCGTAACSAGRASRACSG